MIRSLVAALLALPLCTACNRGAPASSAHTTSTTPVTFSIEGMHCEGCVAAITARLKDIDGVRADTVRVSLADKSATCEITDASLADSIAESVGRMGYTVTPKSAS